MGMYLEDKNLTVYFLPLKDMVMFFKDAKRVRSP